jgi:hypothetical protein
LGRRQCAEGHGHGDLVVLVEVPKNFFDVKGSKAMRTGLGPFRNDRDQPPPGLRSFTPIGPLWNSTLWTLPS